MQAGKGHRFIHEKSTFHYISKQVQFCLLQLLLVFEFIKVPIGPGLTRSVGKSLFGLYVCFGCSE